MSRVKTHWHEEVGQPETDGEDLHLWISHVTGMVQHGGGFVDPETGDLMSLDEAWSLAIKWDDPAWQREQRLDRAAEAAGEDR